MGRWTYRFSHATRMATKHAAPSNKRPRWTHYGAPLKSTFNATTTVVDYRPDQMRVYAAVGSSAPYAVYVDQGTGIHGGDGPYKAKILPPWERGHPSLYESSWIVGGGLEWGQGDYVKQIWIKGQKGQKFFDKGLANAFARMKMLNAKVPGDYIGQVGRKRNTAAQKLEGVIGNTPNDPAFRASLEEWRRWRDDAWSKGSLLGNKKARILASAYREKKDRERRERNAGNEWSPAKAARIRQEREEKAARKREATRLRVAKWREKNKAQRPKTAATMTEAEFRSILSRALRDRYPTMFGLTKRNDKEWWFQTKGRGGRIQKYAYDIKTRRVLPRK